MMPVGRSSWRIRIFTVTLVYGSCFSAGSRGHRYRCECSVGPASEVWWAFWVSSRIFMSVTSLMSRSRTFPKSGAQSCPYFTGSIKLFPSIKIRWSIRFSTRVSSSSTLSTLSSSQIPFFFPFCVHGTVYTLTSALSYWSTWVHNTVLTNFSNAQGSASYGNYSTYCNTKTLDILILAARLWWNEQYLMKQEAVHRRLGPKAVNTGEWVSVIMRGFFFWCR